MKMTVITQDGAIVGTARPNPTAATSSRGQIRGGIVAMAGQQLHEIEVPPDVHAIEDPEELHRRVAAYLPQPAAL